MAAALHMMSPGGAAVPAAASSPLAYAASSPPPGSSASSVGSRHYGAAASAYSGGVVYGSGGGVVGATGGTAVFPSWSGSGPAYHAGGGAASAGSNARWLWRYVRRAAAPASLDWESVGYQVLHAVRAPAKAYRLTQLRKQTKNAWARDDPGVVLVALGALAVAGVAWGVAYGYWSPLDWAVLALHLWVHLAASVVAVLLLTRARRETLTRPRVAPLPHMVAPALEWAYVCEVAVNSFFPFFLAAHCGLLLTAPISLAPGLLGAVVGNGLLGLATALFWHGVFRGFLGESWGWRWLGCGGG